MLRLLFLTFLLSSFAYSKTPWPQLSMADGSVMHARPIDIEDGKIVITRTNVKRELLDLSAFSADEQVKLKLWMTALSKNHHYQVVKRVKGAEQLNILFIGNSYNFKVPKALEKLAQSKQKQIKVEQVTKGGWTLKKHAGSAPLLAKIKNGKYDVIVLQEQSLIPSLPDNQRSSMMNKAVIKLVSAIRESGAEPVFFQTWGRRDGDKQNANVFPDDTFEAMQDRLIHGYSKAAEASGGAHIIPVGEMWRFLRRKEPHRGIKFYQKDGSHPSKAGVDFAAAVIYASLYDEPSGEKITEHTRLFSISYPVK